MWTGASAYQKLEKVLRRLADAYDLELRRHQNLIARLSEDG